MGRRPKPTANHVVSGTYRADRHAQNTSDAAPADTPRCPDHLTGLARWAWMHFAPKLRGLKVLTLSDGMALERLCCVYAEVRDYDTLLANAGTTYSTPPVDKSGNVLRDANGEPLPGIVRIHPAVAARANADNRLRAYLLEFGLTPAARNKAAVAPDTPDDTDQTDRYISR